MQSPEYTFPSTLEHPAQTIQRDMDAHELERTRCRGCERVDRDPPVRFRHCSHMPCDWCGRCLGCAMRPIYDIDGNMIG